MEFVYVDDKQLELLEINWKFFKSHIIKFFIIVVHSLTHWPLLI